MKKRVTIWLILTFLWTCIIWGFSLQPADVSSDLSSGLGRWIVETILPGIIEGVEAMPVQDREMWHTILRKCAHFAEYCVLGVLWSIALMSMTCRYKVRTAVVLCVLTALVDEVIQRFVPGRAGRLSDVLLDSMGAVFGVFIILLMNVFFRTHAKLE